MFDGTRRPDSAVRYRRSDVRAQPSISRINLSTHSIPLQREMKGARQDKTRQDLIVASGARDVALDPCGVSRDLDTMLQDAPHTDPEAG